MYILEIIYVYIKNAFIKKICILEIFQDFYWFLSGLITRKGSMRPYLAKVSIGTGFEPVLNWFQSTALITQLQLTAVTEWLMLWTGK